MAMIKGGTTTLTLAMFYFLLHTLHCGQTMNKLTLQFTSTHGLLGTNENRPNSEEQRTIFYSREIFGERRYKKFYDVAVKRVNRRLRITFQLVRPAKL